MEEEKKQEEEERKIKEARDQIRRDAGLEVALPCLHVSDWVPCPPAGGRRAVAAEASRSNQRHRLAHRVKQRPDLCPNHLPVLHVCGCVCFAKSTIFVLTGVGVWASVTVVVAVEAFVRDVGVASLLFDPSWFGYQHTVADVWKDAKKPYNSGHDGVERVLSREERFPVLFIII